MTRPPELEAFYLLHGKPLEVGMAVNISETHFLYPTYDKETIVQSITMGFRDNIEVSDGYYDEFSPLDLEPYNGPTDPKT